jgi:hypothetical protein
MLFVRCIDHVVESAESTPSERRDHVGTSVHSLARRTLAGEASLTYEDALNRLDAWIRQSNGSPFRMPSGKFKAFKRERLFDAGALDRLEFGLGIRLPDAHRRLLSTVGAGELFVDERGSSLRTYDPETIRGVFEGFWDDPADIFRRFLPVAVDEVRQEVGAYLLAYPPPKNFLVVSHEYPPDDWPEVAEETGLISLEDWVQEAVMTEGDLPVH